MKNFALIVVFLLLHFSCLVINSDDSDWCHGNFCNPEAVQDSLQNSIDTFPTITTYPLVVHSAVNNVAWDSVLTFLNGCFQDSIQFSYYRIYALDAIPINDKINADEYRESLPYLDGYLNIYLCPDDDVIDLFGFVLMPEFNFDQVESVKAYNQVFLSPHDIKETIVHELGHSFSLPHLFEDERNHMSYARFPTEFLPWQLSQMRQFAAKYRKGQLRELEL